MRPMKLLVLAAVASLGITPLGCASGGSDQDVDNPPSLSVEEADFLFWYRDMISATDVHPQYRRIPINSPSGQRAFNELLENAYFGRITAEQFISTASGWYPDYETSVRIMASYLPSAAEQEQTREDQ
jgi:hypothetical protein